MQKTKFKEKAFLNQLKVSHSITFSPKCLLMLTYDSDGYEFPWCWPEITKRMIYQAFKTRLIIYIIRRMPVKSELLIQKRRWKKRHKASLIRKPKVSARNSISFSGSGLKCDYFIRHLILPKSGFRFRPIANICDQNFTAFSSIN